MPAPAAFPGRLAASDRPLAGTLNVPRHGAERAGCLTPGVMTPASRRSGGMVDAMTLGRASAVLLVGMFLSAGCGSATGPTASTGTGAQPAGSRSIRSADSGIAGQTVGIVCGGPASEHGCPRRPVIATIDILRLPSRQRIATVRTDNRGHFHRNLPPGTYTLQAHASSQLIRARPVTARVRPHQIEHATITFVPRHPLPVAPASASG